MVKKLEDRDISVLLDNNKKQRIILSSTESMSS